MKYIRFFNEISLKDVGLVGGKNASIGQMVNELKSVDVRIPHGFAITVDAYWYFIQYNELEPRIEALLAPLHANYILEQLHTAGKNIRSAIQASAFPSDLQQEIIQAYKQLSQQYGTDKCDVAVRSSATAEDLPNASFAGQQESFLNVAGEQNLMDACKRCFASLFTDRAISYRFEQQFSQLHIGLSIGVQKMIRSDMACSGVAFSLDTESGSENVVLIEGSYGLGELIVKGEVIPDEFMVHKQALKAGYRSIVKKDRGEKTRKLVYMKNGAGVQTESVPQKEQRSYCLTDDEVLELARAVCQIEDHYSALKKRCVPMDIEWAKDGIDGKLYIIQARPETVHAGKKESTIYRYVLTKPAGPVLVRGQSIGQQIVAGRACVIDSLENGKQLRPGDILVTDMTTPDWGPLMSTAAGIVTNRGGRTCHAAIVARELAVPALVGTHEGTTKIPDGQMITLDCSTGLVGSVYQGEALFEKKELPVDLFAQSPVSLKVNIAHPESALGVAQLPVSGVGLARTEFIIAQDIRVHPMALLNPEKITDQAVANKIDEITAGYTNKSDFFVETLARSMGMIAAAFYPRPVTIRFSDFKSNEYRQLLGGAFFELNEENPMIGFRGASRYYHERYAPAFALECAAFVRARTELGLDNIEVMLPFVRTVGEAQRVVELMARNGIARPEYTIIMMCEIPANVLLIDSFCKLFDGISIGSNDLTQLTLGVDRDSELLAPLFDENNEALRIFFTQAVHGAQRNRVSSSVCGQAPSDCPEIAELFIQLGIDSISLNPDAVIPFLLKYAR